MVQLTQQRGGLVGGGVAHQLDVKIIIKGDMGQRTALDGLHVVAEAANDLDDLSQKQQEIEEGMAAAANDYPKLAALQKELNEVQQEVDEKTARWEYLSNYVE